MSFHDVLFPTGISRGARGGPSFSTSVQITDSGFEQRISRWGTPKRVFDIGYGLKTQEDLYAIYDFVIARDGPAHSFRYKDWLDFTTASDGKSAVADDDVQIGTGDGSEDTFQLIKKYGPVAFEKIRNITKPVDGTALIAVNGVLQTEGSDYSINYNTGIVTFTSIPAASHAVTWGGQFHVHARFGKEVDEGFMIEMIGYDASEAPNIPIVEVRDEAAIDESYNYRGSKDHGEQSATMTLSLSDGAFQIIEPTKLMVVKLPPETDLPDGSDIITIKNSAPATYNLAIRYNDGTVIDNIAAGEVKTLALLDEGGGTLTWYMY